VATKAPATTGLWIEGLDLTALPRVAAGGGHRQATRLPGYKDYWLPAMEQQLRSLRERDVFVLVPRKRGMKVLPGKWVFDEKMDQMAGITTARARWGGLRQLRNSLMEHGGPLRRRRQRHAVPNLHGTDSHPRPRV
jgi:hypothetical protein